jgi:hypothetical protein
MRMTAPSFFSAAFCPDEVIVVAHAVASNAATAMLHSLRQPLVAPMTLPPVSMSVTALDAGHGRTC